MAKTVKDLENVFKRIKNMDIINENVAHVTNFLEQLSAEGVGRPRQIKYLYTLGKLAKMLDKDFCEECIVRPTCNQVNDTIGQCDIMRMQTRLKVLRNMETFENGKSDVFFHPEGGYTVLERKGLVLDNYNLDYRKNLIENEEWINTLGKGI